MKWAERLSRESGERMRETEPKREGQKIKKNEESKKKYNSKCDCPQLIKRNEFSLLSIIQRVISIS